MKFAKLVFSAAGIWGIIILLPQLFLEKWNGRQYPPAINHPEYYYGFLGVGLVWQVLFLMLARDPQRYRVFMLAAIMEKAVFVAAIVWLFVDHRVGSILLILASVDALWGLLFAVSYIRTPSPPAT